MVDFIQLFSLFDVLRVFEPLQILFYKFLLKWGKIGESLPFVNFCKFFKAGQKNVTKFPQNASKVKLLSK